ncbi:hypothetical protein C6W10_15990 [Plantactinospora sp. BB1]|nr:hypothetical protein C6W10_15990 [Plantactinospora sp. BB1]
MDASTRALWLAVIIAFSFMVGVAAGVLTAMGTRDPVAGILPGAGGFGGTVFFLLLAMAAFLVPASDRT